MKQRLLFLLFVLCAAFSLTAQNAPQGFNYQSIVRTSTGDPLANQTVVLLFSIRNGAPNGPVAYSEKQTISSNEFGLVNLVVGQGGTPLQGDFTTINWGNGAKYLTVALETSPNVFDELGSSQLMSVPYALYAQSAANGGTGGDNWGSQTVQTTPALSGNGTSSNPLGIAQQGAQTGQVLKWDGTKWIPQDDITDSGSGGGTVTQVNTGTGLTGGPITTSGIISLENTGVTPGIYGSATEIPVITVDAQGRVTEVSKTTLQSGTIDAGAGIDVQQNGADYTIVNTGDIDPNDDLTNSSIANGDVQGLFSNLQLKAGVVGDLELSDGSVTAAKLDDMGASNGQVLKWNGSDWVPSADAGITSVGITAGAGITVAGSSPNFTITNSGDTNAADDITTTSTANGDVTGTFSNLQIKPDVVTTSELADNAVETANVTNQAITGAKIAQQGATNGQVLKWNGSTWTPQNDLNSNFEVLAGPGIDVAVSSNSYTVFNTGDLDGLDDVKKTDLANGDITGTFDNLQIKPSVITNLELTNNSVGTANLINGAVTGVKINNMGAAIGQVLKWNGTTWLPQNDNAGGDNWGTQVVIADPTLTGSGTTGSPLKIAQQGATVNQVLKWNGSTWFPGADQGDNWGSQAVWTSGPELAGNGTLGSPVRLEDQGATPGQVLKWNGADWVPGNDIGGDNWGAQVVVTSTTLSGNGTVGTPLNIAQQGATPGQVLQWNGSSWTPASFSGDNWGAQVAVTGAALLGNGTAGNPLNLAPQGANAGEVLKWNGSAWVPAGDAVGGTGDVYSGGTGISVTGSSPNFVIDNTGDLSNTNEIQALSIAGDQLSLSLGGGTVTLPASNSYAAGTGISITGSAPNFTINNTGDADANPSNELQTISIAGNDITLSQGGGTITLPSGNTYTAGTGISITGSSPNFVINNTGDADADPTNELQTLNLTGTILEISGSGSTVDFTDMLNGAGLGYWKLDNDNIYNTNAKNVLIGTTTGTIGRFQVENSSSEPAAFFNSTGGPALVTGDGNVGIRNNNPLFRLDVNGEGRFFTPTDAPQLVVENGSAGTAKILLKNGGAGGWTMSGSGGVSGLFSIDFPTSLIGSNIFTATTNGQVGVGGINASASRMTVFNKDIQLSLENSSTSRNWDFWVSDPTGDLVLYNDLLGPGVPAGTFSAATGFYLPSDRRLKKEIAAIPKGILQKLMQLEPVTYLYNAEKASDKRSIGFLAQDVQALFPELVGQSPVRNGEGGYLSLNYAGFGILAVKAIQEQQTEIEALKNENSTLRQQLESLEVRLQRLEKKQN